MFVDRVMGVMLKLLNKITIIVAIDFSINFAVKAEIFLKFTVTLFIGKSIIFKKRRNLFVNQLNNKFTVDVNFTFGHTDINSQSITMKDNSTRRPREKSEARIKTRRKSD